MNVSASDLSQKEKLFRVVVETGHLRDWADLKSHLDFFIDPHNGTHLLYSLQKEGRIVFREKNEGGSKTVVDIEPSKQVLTGEVNLQPPYVLIDPAAWTTRLAEEGITEVQPGQRGNPGRVHTAKTKGRHPVGRDNTDAKNHKAVAQGGPIERTHTSPVDRAIETIRQADPITADRGYQNEKPVIAQKTFPKIFDVIEWAKFPLISQLVGRGEKVAQAAALMEEAGLVDQAVAILDTIKVTPFEQEVLALVKDLR